MRVIKNCAYCKLDYSVISSRKQSKYCSVNCSRKGRRKRAEVRCKECATLFERNASAANAKRVWGHFCSTSCIGVYRARVCVGQRNSNFRGRNFDHDGYRIFTPQASLKLGLGRMKVHHAVALTVLGIKSIPKGMHVHHRDCDVLNNDPSNLALLTNSDHRWLHCQYGTAGLSAIAKGLVDVGEAASWSDDPLRAAYLLVVNVETQAKLGEALGDGWRSRLPELSCVKAMQVSFVEY